MITECESWNEKQIIKEGAYLEQVIDDIAVFEVVDDKSEINNIFVKIKNRDDFVENYYYHMNVSFDEKDTFNYLPPNDNEWIYKYINKDDIYMHFDLDVEKTQRVKRDNEGVLRRLQIRAVLMNELYKYILGDCGDVYKKILFKEAKVKCYEYYEKYLENMNKNIVNKEDSNHDLVVPMTKKKWRNYLYYKLKGIINEGEKADDEKYAISECPNMNVADIALFLNVMDAKHYVIYREGFYKLLKRLYWSGEHGKNKTCRSSDYLENVKSYRKYNNLLIECMENMFEDKWKNGEMDNIKLAMFIDSFSTEKFIWNNVLRQRKIEEDSEK